MLLMMLMTPYLITKYLLPCRLTSPVIWKNFSSHITLWKPLFDYVILCNFRVALKELQKNSALTFIKPLLSAVINCALITKKNRNIFCRIFGPNFVCRKVCSQCYFYNEAIEKKYIIRIRVVYTIYEKVVYRI